MFLQAKTSKFILIVGMLVGFLGSFKFVYSDNQDFFKGELSRGQVLGRDFLNWWTVANLATESKYNDIYNPELLVSHTSNDIKKSGVVFNFAYPPQTLFPVSVLSNFSYIKALILWSFIGVFIFSIPAFIFQKSKLFSLLVVFSPTTFLNLTTGQNGLFTGALLICGLMLLESKPILSGLLFGLLTIKPHLGLLIPIALIAGGYRKAFIWAVISTVSLIIVSVIFFGVGVWEAWFNNSPWDYSKNFIESGVGLAIFMQPSPFVSIRMLFDNINLAWFFQALSSIFTVGCVIYAFKKCKLLELKVSVLIVATYLVTPYIHSYDMTAFSMVIIWQLSRGIQRGFIYGEQTLLMVAWLMPISMMPLGYLGFPVFPLVTLTLLIFLMYKIKDYERFNDDLIFK